MSTTPDPVTMTMMSATDALQTCTEACAGWQQEIARFVDLRLAENRRSWESADDGTRHPRRHQGAAGMGPAGGDRLLAEAVRLTRLLTTLSLTGTTPAVQDAAKLVA